MAIVTNVANRIKGRFIAMAGSISGATSILGSWQVCHNLCLGLVVFLGILGIAVAGMPLMFLQKISLPFWVIAASLLLMTLFIYLKKRCISHKLIIFNSGLIVAGIPFQSLQSFSPIFWIVGGTLVVFSILLFIKDKIKGKEHEKIH